jgi:hypothetical protein
MGEIIRAVVSAPIANLVLLGGLIFVGIAIVGNISGKLELGRTGRLAAGVVGGLLLVVGLSMDREPSASTQNQLPSPNLVATPTQSLTPSPSLPATPAQNAVLFPEPSVVVPQNPEQSEERAEAEAPPEKQKKGRKKD